MISAIALLSFGAATLASTGANAQFPGHAPLIQGAVTGADAKSEATVIQVRNRKRHNRRRGNRGRNHGAEAAVGIFGAIIGGAIIANEANNRRDRRERRHIRADSHVDWCYDRYRSYRESDNTFQPYEGRRRQCHSPY
ncbi:BA14K family protein [Hoeflea sp. Naph1]|uniref:BA14K family protein n=1 Tax=Hoeflea sp. Naph1 TaxID=3388653 RepID=UPI00399028E6